MNDDVFHDVNHHKNVLRAHSDRMDLIEEKIDSIKCACICKEMYNKLRLAIASTEHNYCAEPRPSLQVSIAKSKMGDSRGAITEQATLCENDLPYANTTTIRTGGRITKTGTPSISQTCCDVTRTDIVTSRLWNQDIKKPYKPSQPAVRRRSMLPESKITPMTTADSTADNKNEWKLVGKKGRPVKPKGPSRQPVSIRKPDIDTPKIVQNKQAAGIARRTRNINVPRRCLLLYDSDFDQFDTSMLTRLFDVDSHNMKSMQSTLNFLQKASNLNLYETIYIHLWC